MRRLVLFRHAKAEGPNPAGDHARRLAPRGRAAAPAMGAWLAREGLLPDRALVSDAERTRETFALAAAALPEPVAVTFEPRLYEAPPERVIALVRALGAGPRLVWVVGHNPSMAAAAMMLAGHGDRYTRARMGRKFPTCGVAVIDFAMESFADLAEGEGRLDRFVTPASLDPGAVDD